MTAKKLKSLRQLFVVCEKLYSEVFDQFKKAYMDDYEADPYETVIGITDNKMQGCFSDSTVKLAEVVKKLGDCFIALDELAREDDKKEPPQPTPGF